MAKTTVAQRATTVAKGVIAPRFSFFSYSGLALAVLFISAGYILRFVRVNTSFPILIPHPATTTTPPSASYTTEPYEDPVEPPPKTPMQDQLRHGDFGLFRVICSNHDPENYCDYEILATTSSFVVFAFLGVFFVLLYLPVPLFPRQ